MGYYAIGIGGTGAKCLEALIHLAAAGMMPDKKEELSVLFVDPDKANGCLERAVKVLECYKTFSNNPQLAQPCLLRTPIHSVNTPIFSPFDNGDDGKPQLDKFLNYAGLKLGANSAAADLFEVLYSKKERETELHEGFRGHPSIGAAVMAQTVLGGDEPWKTFQAKVAKDPNAKIFLTGSIFGGTGASGFPTIAQLIKNALKGKPITAQLGGALVLPYFTIIDTDQKDQLKAKAEHFLMNTQAALKYYRQWNKGLVYNAIYLIGDDSQVEVQNFSLGGKTQQNAQHFVELYAALAAIHFFGNDGAADGAAQYFRLNRANNPLKWADLPDGNDGVEIQSKLRNLYHFSVAYLQYYKPMLDDIRNGKISWNDAPPYIDFFEKNKPNRISLKDANIEKSLNWVKDYCEDFLVWFANVQHSKDNNGKFNPLDKFDLTEVINRISSDATMQPLSTKALNRLWQNMCSAKGKSAGTDIGKFLSALYQNCGKI